MNVKKKATIKAYISTFGNVTQTCKSVGIERKTFYNWKEADKKFAKAIEEAEPKERFLDYLEAKALQRINKGSDKILLHALKTKAKKRGWSEKQELTIKGDKKKPLIWKIIRDAESE